MLNEKMLNLGKKSSVIREIFEFGKKRAAEIGKENVYDYSLGNPSVPAPEKVNETIRKLTEEMFSCELHGYTSAVGDNATRT
ncbi:MAG: pyridoxal phosphate-dependent aminotransferase, partial [Clostridia bacterium]|nr:pyridoxal phosphate-dependent aminotransferase [Clostridia bacterium]